MKRETERERCVRIVQSLEVNMSGYELSEDAFVQLLLDERRHAVEAYKTAQKKEPNT